jgi:amidophosphoribosyltransferase
LGIVDATYEREVRPGEMVIITKDGIESRQIAEGQEKLDMFELVYFARPDSILYGMAVNDFRYESGKALAAQHPPQIEDGANVLVIPVPDTSIPAAEGYAEALGVQQRQLIIKNRYIGRTFMQPTHAARQGQLRRKHSFVPDSIKGRDVTLIDDSIVRLNTIPRLVALAKSEGARSVNVLIASPPVRFPDYYGIDTPQQVELAAANMTVEEMRHKIDCDYLGFLGLSRMVGVTGQPAEKFNLSPFNGEYPIGIGRHKQDIKTPVSMEYAD